MEQKPDAVPDRVPEEWAHPYLGWMRANLTDPLYEAMTANPNGRVPFLLAEA